MKRLTISTTILALAIMLLPASVFGQDTPTPAVTGAGQASLPAGANYAGVNLSSLTFGAGVFIPGDSTAAGDFQATLSGTTILGIARDIEVEGIATAGSIASGTGTFSGTATVDLGDGTPPLTNVPFTVTASPTSLILVLGATNLPVATVTLGDITVE
jgi:hypothetical protein